MKITVGWARVGTSKKASRLVIDIEGIVLRMDNSILRVKLEDQLLNNRGEFVEEMIIFVILKSGYFGSVLLDGSHGSTSLCFNFFGGGPARRDHRSDAGCLDCGSGTWGGSASILEDPRKFMSSAMMPRV
jgi:hypothetical protein